jgi:hypothetical protein
MTVFQHIQEATGEMAAVEGLSKHPDRRLQVANIPAITPARMSWPMSIRNWLWRS